MNAPVERIHASGGGEIQILKQDVFRTHPSVRFGSKRTGGILTGYRTTDTTNTHASNTPAAPAALFD
jgi:hypothetical protein